MEDLETIMSAAGFASITVLEKFRWRQQRGFAFRASRSDAQDVIQVKYGTADIAVNLQQRKDFARKAAMPLPGEKRIKFTKHGVPKNPKPQESQDFPMGESKDGDQENGKRSAAELAVENKKAKIVSQITGFIVKSTLQCPIQAVTHLRKYCDAYKGHWDGCYPKQQDEQIPDKNFQTYLDHLAKPGSWGSALEVMATAFTLDKPIYVLRPGAEHYVFNKNGKKKPLFLKYENHHYTALIPKNEETPAIDNAIEGPHQGMRGAASTAGARTSVRQRMAPKSTCTLITIKQVLKKKAGAGSMTQPASTKPHWEAPDACSLPLSNFESTASASCGQVDKSRVSDTFVWSCNLCQAATQQPSMRKLTEWRHNHIACVHKAGRPLVNTIKTTLTVIQATKLPWNLTSWVCCQCDQGLPHCDSREQLRKSARAHLQTHSSNHKKCLSLKENWQRLCKKHHPRIVKYAMDGNRKGYKTTCRRLEDKFAKIATDSGHTLFRISVMRKPRPGKGPLPGPDALALNVLEPGLILKTFQPNANPLLSVSWSKLKLSCADGNTSVTTREPLPRK